MVPSLALFQRAFVLLADDTATWNNGGDPVRLVLVKNNVNFSKATVIGDLVQATFTGYSTIEIDITLVEQALDPLNDDSLVDVRAGATPFRWETTNTTGLPQVIYGYALVNNAMDLYFCGASFDEPITLNAINQQVSVSLAQLRMAAGAIT